MVADKSDQFVAAIKSKKGLETLDNAFVQQKIDKIFNANHILKRKFEESKTFAQFSRSKEYEELLKRIRKELRAIYGVFQSDRKGLFAALKDPKTREEAIIKLLESHKSTKERVPHYDEIYEEICDRIKPSVVIDLGCGMNPLAYEYFIKNGVTPAIIASDISGTDMELIAEAFTALNIPGETLPLDLTKDYEKLKELKGDVTFLLKLLDSLEETHRHISYKIFDNITTPWIIASFPTKSLGGGKNIARAGRTWFERLLKRKELTWETFSVENELFYVIKQS